MQTIVLALEKVQCSVKQTHLCYCRRSTRTICSTAEHCSSGLTTALWHFWMGSEQTTADLERITATKCACERSEKVDFEKITWESQTDVGQTEMYLFPMFEAKKKNNNYLFLHPWAPTSHCSHYLGEIFWDPHKVETQLESTRSRSLTRGVSGVYITKFECR